MNNETFAIGEVAILRNIAGEFQHLNGMECEIVKHHGLHRDTLTGNEVLGYLVKCPAVPHKLICKQSQLRKKRPPQTGYQMIIQMFGKTPRLEIA